MQLIPWSFQTPNGFTLRGHRSEPSNKPLLHVLHGNGFCSLMYAPMLEILSERYDLFLSDAQGHGDSDHGGDFVGWNKSAELAELAWLAHKEHYPNVNVYGLGHSFGGILTAIINAKSTSPFTGIVLLDPILFTPAMLTLMNTLDTVRLYHKNPMAKAALRRKEHWPDTEHATSYFTNRGMFRNWHPDALNAYITYALKPSEYGLSLKCKPSREAEIFASYPEKLWSKLTNDCPPVQVLYGDNTYNFVAKSLKKWQRKNAAVQVKEVKGGHCFMQEYPTESAKHIEEAISLLNKQVTAI